MVQETRPIARPLSPHLQVYRWPISMALSILHRATGIALTGGTIMLVYWLASAAAGPVAFENAQWFLGSILGQIMLLGWSWSLMFHLCTGIRHLVWDTGRGLAVDQAELSAWMAIGASTALTLVAWILAYVLGA